MKRLKPVSVLLVFILVFFMQSGSIAWSGLPESAYSDEELISPQNDNPPFDINVT